MQNYTAPSVPQPQQQWQQAYSQAMPGQPQSYHMMGNAISAYGQALGGPQYFNSPRQPMNYGMPQPPWGQMPGFGQGGNPYLGYGNGIAGGQGASPMMGGSQYQSPYGWGGYGMQPTVNNMGYQRFGFG